MAGDLLVVGGPVADGRSHFQVTRDGSTWHPLVVPARVASIAEVGTSLVAITDEPSGAGVLLSLDGGRSWAAGELRSLFDGRAVQRPWGGASVSDDGAVTLVVGVQQGASFVPYVLRSHDGRAWSREPIVDIAGIDRDGISFVNRLQSAGESVVLAVRLANADPTASPRQLVLVGTPSG